MLVKRILLQQNELGFPDVSEKWRDEWEHMSEIVPVYSKWVQTNAMKYIEQVIWNVFTYIQYFQPSTLVYLSTIDRCMWSYTA